MGAAPAQICPQVGSKMRILQQLGPQVGRAAGWGSVCPGSGQTPHLQRNQSSHQHLSSTAAHDNIGSGSAGVSGTRKSGKLGPVHMGLSVDVN